MYTGIYTTSIIEKGQLGVVLKMAYTRAKGAAADEAPTTRPQVQVTIAPKDFMQARRCTTCAPRGTQLRLTCTTACRVTTDAGEWLDNNAQDVLAPHTRTHPRVCVSAMQLAVKDINFVEAAQGGGRDADGFATDAAIGALRGTGKGRCSIFLHC